MKKVLKKIWEVMRQVIGFVGGVGLLIFIGISMLLSYGVLIPFGSILKTIINGGSLCGNLKEAFISCNKHMKKALEQFKG